MHTRVSRTPKRRLLIILMLAGLALTWAPGMLPADPPAIAGGPGAIQPAGYSWGG